MKVRLLFNLILTLLILNVLVASTEIPKLHQRVTDFTNTLTYQEWKMLEKILKEFEDSTSVQIAVLIIRSLERESIEEFAYKVFSENKIGQAGKNNGVLLVIARDDRKMKIEVGYGLEGVLTDAIASRIIRNEIIPHFREDNYFAGLVNGIDAIMRATAGEYRADNGNGTTTIFPYFLFFLILLSVIGIPIMAGRRRRIIGGGQSVYYSGWSFGGWHGYLGGGFRSSGWSGGGGFSGGGGATGSW
ncbi:MAG: TPM domain-containing protein [Bacteroidetes bacterium]|nr:TPM domain-containing protein [Bacteroidota bacterium]